MKIVSVDDSLLVLGRGIGQVMFQNNAFSGLLMLIGIFLNSWEMGILALSGNMISTLTAYFSGYGRDDIKDGLFQGNIWTGLFFLVGILVNSRTAAFYTVIGTLLPIPLAILLGIDADTLNMGLMGYNGVLCVP